MSKLWYGYDIPVITVAGEAGAGKTLFGLTCGDDRPVLVFDYEGSSASYEGILNIKRLDVPTLLLEHYNGDYDSEDIYHHFSETIGKIREDYYSVVLIDTVSELEDAIAAFVKKNPGKFGYSSRQFDKLTGVMWGCMKAEWKKLILMLCMKCDTVVLTAHMREDYKNTVPTGKRVPKGKDTILDLSSLYMVLDRKTKSGSKEVPIKPSGSVVKCRLVMKDGGELKPVLPPRLPDATPDGIRKYLKEPADLMNLNPEEQAISESTLTDDERLALTASIASSKAEIEKAKAEGRR